MRAATASSTWFQLPRQEICGARSAAATRSASHVRSGPGRGAVLEVEGDEGAAAASVVAQECAGRELYGLQRDVTDGDQGAVRCQLLERLHQLRTADAVHDGVHGGAGVLRSRDDLIGAQFAQAAAVCAGVTGGGDHVCTLEVCELYRVASDASGGAGDENALAGQRAEPSQRAQGAGARDREGAERSRVGADWGRAEHFGRPLR